MTHGNEVRTDEVPAVLNVVDLLDEEGRQFSMEKPFTLSGVLALRKSLFLCVLVSGVASGVSAGLWAPQAMNIAKMPRPPMSSDRG